jgi:hypothetical protein
MEGIRESTAATQRERLDGDVAAQDPVGIPSTGTGQALRLLRMTGLVLVWLALWFVPGRVSTAQTPAPAKVLTPLEQSLMASEKSLIEAKKKDDDAFFKRTLSMDFTLVGVDGQLLERQEAVDGLGDSELAQLTPYDMKVVMAGDSAAVVTYDAVLRQKPQEDQGPPPRYQHFSSVWVKQGDRWKLKFHQSTPTHWGDW